MHKAIQFISIHFSFSYSRSFYILTATRKSLGAESMICLLRLSAAGSVLDVRPSSSSRTTRVSSSPPHSFSARTHIRVRIQTHGSHKQEGRSLSSASFRPPAYYVGFTHAFSSVATERSRSAHRGAFGACCNHIDFELRSNSSNSPGEKEKTSRNIR